MRLDGVHGDGDAREAGVGEGLSQLSEQVSVGGNSDIEPIACPGSHLAELTNHIDKSSPEQGLTTGKADLRDPKTDEDAHHT
jgi:hypothetical protein